MKIELTLWQQLRLWVEDDATQLGMELTAYYFLCAFVGFIEGIGLATAWGWLP